MSYMTKESIMKRLQEHYDEAAKHGELFGVFLQGSQNYVTDLFFESSDVDSRAVYIPNKKDIILGRDISKAERVLDNGEHIDRFDIRKFVSLLKKPGINNYEALFSEYFIINDKYKDFHKQLVDLREGIARADEGRFLMSTMGVSRRDLKHLLKRSGGEDSDIEKYGYSRKRLSNIIRFNMTSQLYSEGEKFTDCLRAMGQQYIYDVRRTELYDLEEALVIAERMDRETYKLAESYAGVVSDASVLDELDDLLVELLSAKVKES